MKKTILAAFIVVVVAVAILAQQVTTPAGSSAFLSGLNGGTTVNGLTPYQFVTSNFTTAANTNLQTITGLSWTFPANTQMNVPVHCQIQWSQATAAVADSFGVQTATVAATNWQWGGVSFSGTSNAATQGNISSAAGSTTATAIVTATPAATATVYTAVLDGFMEIPSNASTSVFSVMAKTSTAGDAITVYRGSWCRLF